MIGDFRLVLQPCVAGCGLPEEIRTMEFSEIWERYWPSPENGISVILKLYERIGARALFDVSYIDSLE